MPGERILRHVLLLLLVLDGSAGIGYAQASPGTDAGTRRELILERGRFLEPLPFDVQFYLFGAAPADLVYAKGRFAHLTRALRQCDQVVPPKPPTPAVVTVTDPPPSTGTAPALARRGAPKPPRIHAIELARPHVEDEKSVFELSVSPLDPNRDYCFEFELFYKLDPAEVRALAFRAIDTALRNAVGRERTLAAPAAYDEMRREIVSALEVIRARKEVEKGLRVEILPASGAFFDLTIKAMELPARFRREFDQTLEAQDSFIMLTRQFGSATSEAQVHADALLNDPAFRRMVRHLSERATNPALALRLTGVTGALGFASRPESERLAAPFGLPAAALRVAPPLEQTWDPADIGVRITNLDDRIRELTTLRDLARDLADLQGLRRAAGLDERTASGAPNPEALSSEALANVADLAERARASFESSRNLLELMQTSLNDRSTAITEMTDDVQAETSRLVPFKGTTTSAWQTRASQYISVDVGVASAPSIDSTFFYVGTNFYTGPVNKRAHLSWSDQSFRKRFAVLFAIPLNPFAEDQEAGDQFEGTGQEIKGVLGNRPLLLGAGWRLTDVVRLTGGTVLFKVKGANPLVDADPKPHFTWFMSISVDWDIKNFFSGLAGSTPANTQTGTGR